MSFFWMSLAPRNFEKLPFGRGTGVVVVDVVVVVVPAVVAAAVVVPAAVVMVVVMLSPELPAGSKV